MNRRQRRAQASSSKPINSVDEIPLAQPDRSQGSAKAKTLYELAAEKQATLIPNAKASGSLPSVSKVVNVTIGPNGEVISDDHDGDHDADGETPLAESEAVPPVLDTLFFSTSLSALHFTLEVLTVHQYAQELLFTPIFQHTLFMAFPTLFLLIHLFRGHLLPTSAQRVSPQVRRIASVAQQSLFMIIANYAGCYLVQLTNDKGYYAVMKNAPSVGTVWVWAVIEMGLAGALAGVVGPLLYAWYWGYSFV